VKSIYNHVIFLDSENRNKLHMGEEAEGYGFMTDINMKKGKLDFSVINEQIVNYKICSTANKSEIVFVDTLKENLESESYLHLKFNHKKLKLNIDDILDAENGGKEKLVLMIMEKNSTSYFSIGDSSLIEKNYVFFDEINNFSEPMKI